MSRIYQRANANRKFRGWLGSLSLYLSLTDANNYLGDLWRALYWNAFLVQSGASDARTSSLFPPSSTLTLLFPLPLFVRLFTAFACECKRAKIYMSTCLRLLFHVFVCVPLYGSAMRHEGISKCTGSRNNAKSHGCVYIVVHERAASLNIRSKSRETAYIIRAILTSRYDDSLRYIVSCTYFLASRVISRRMSMFVLSHRVVSRDALPRQSLK